MGDTGIGGAAAAAGAGGAGGTGGIDTQAMLNQAQAQMQDQMAMQLGMQQMSNEHNMQSSMAKMQYETDKSTIQRLDSVAQSVSNLTDQQSQALAQ